MPASEADCTRRTRRDAQRGEAALEIRDRSGELVRRFSSLGLDPVGGEIALRRQIGRAHV